MRVSEFARQFQVGAGKTFRIKDHDPRWAGSNEFRQLKKGEIKAQARVVLDKSLKDLESAQELLYADDRFALLIVLQGMDASGKDGAIKHVMSGVNPLGCQAFSFKKPSAEEYDHNFLWRYSRALPERGRIGLFNRSYYEDVLVTRVHPELLGQIPKSKINERFWETRYEDINGFERHLVRNGTVVLKFFLNVSKAEQRRRLSERLDQPAKNWKFNPGDLVERGFWNDYMAAYERAVRATDTKWAPWHVVPADHKWVARVVIARIVTETLTDLKLAYPKVTPEQARQIAKAKRELAKK